MNVTELARKIKIPTSELLSILPRLGFDIGRKAIKVDDKVAKKIIDKIKSEPDIITKLQQEDAAAQEETDEAETTERKKIIMPATITVRDFADILNKPVAMVIQELMKNGILANLNEQIDYETASIIAQDFGFDTSPQEEKKEISHDEKTIEKVLAKDKDNLKPRPPVVVIMGHVDHGKTQLLDTIRQTNVMAGESGSITQHIGAYQVAAPTREESSSRPHADERGIPRQTQDDRAKRTITFIDTPGHQAFTAMRSRGARIADMAILVIAAEDGIKTQTKEAIKIIQSAKLPFIVAINKIDKPGADVEKVKQQLTQHNLLPEDWGGKIICVPISAKTGQGIDDLLDHLLLLNEVEKDNIQANPDRTAIGTIIESHVDKGEGPVATVIIQTGTLKKGDTVRVGQVVGKIRTLKDFTNKTVSQAIPSMPVKILGLKDVPEVGDYLQIIEDDTSLKKMKKQLQHRQKIYRDKQMWQRTRTKEDDSKVKKIKSLNIILKTDVLGSQEAIAQSLETLGSEDVKIQIIKKGLGNITETDVLQAESANAIIYGFNVKTNARVEEMASEKDVAVQLHDVIYGIIENTKKEADKLKSLKIETIELGRVKILAVFRTEKMSMIVGGQVTKGKIEQDTKAIVMRQQKKISQGKIDKLQMAKQDVSEVPAGTECGIQYKGDPIIQVGDFLEVYKDEIVK